MVRGWFLKRFTGTGKIYQEKLIRVPNIIILTGLGAKI
jgi:hypothetical protein